MGDIVQDSFASMPEARQPERSSPAPVHKLRRSDDGGRQSQVPFPFVEKPGYGQQSVINIKTEEDYVGAAQVMKAEFEKKLKEQQ